MTLPETNSKKKHQTKNGHNLGRFNEISEIGYTPENYPLKRDYFNRKYIFQPLIFRGHVSFPEGKRPIFLRAFLLLNFREGELFSKKISLEHWDWIRYVKIDASRLQGFTYYHASQKTSIPLNGCLSWMMNIDFHQIST